MGVTKAILQDVSHSPCFSTESPILGLQGLRTYLPLLICYDVFLAAEPSLRWEKWADKTPSAAWTLPVILGRLLISLLLLCAS